MLPSAKVVPLGLGAPATTPRRVTRRPSHPFNVHNTPYAITPFHIAPVLPGETLSTLSVMSRAVSDQIKNPLVGWHLEHHFFYVPLRRTGMAATLDDPTGQGTPVNRTPIEQMLLDQGAPLSYSSEDGTGGEEFYLNRANEGVAWVEKCLHAVTNEFFRDEGASYNIATATGFGGGTLPLAKFRGRDWTDSVFTDDEIEGVDVPVTPGSPDVVDAETMDTMYQTWLMLRSQTLTEMSFEDYQATFGVKQSATYDGSRVERIMSVSNWSYPTNTVSPVDVLDSADTVIVPAGTPSAAMSWSVSQRSNKRLFFKEPGFIFGVTLARPKMYLGRQLNSAASMLNDALSWMPAAYKDAVQLSLRKFAATKGPLGQAGARASKGYFVDLRDLFTYGEQFVDAPVSANVLAQGNLFAALPTANAPHASDADHIYNQYPAAADLSKLFIDANKRYVHQDGVVDLAILGTQVDHT